MRALVALVAVACSAPAPVPVPAPAAAAADRWAWPDWKGCVEPSAGEFLATDGEGKLVAIDAATLKRRVFVDAAGRAAIDLLHGVVWFNNGDGMWTIDLANPCTAPRAVLLGPAGGDFGIDFGDNWNAGSVSTHCGSHQFEWTLDEPASGFEINQSYTGELAKAGSGKPTPIARGRVALGGSGAHLVVAEDGTCAIEAGGARRELECSGFFDLHLDRSGSRWLYGREVCTVAGCRAWDTSPDETAMPVGWFAPGPIWAVADTSEGC